MREGCAALHAGELRLAEREVASLAGMRPPPDPCTVLEADEAEFSWPGRSTPGPSNLGTASAVADPLGYGRNTARPDRAACNRCATRPCKAATQGKHFIGRNIESGPPCGPRRPEYPRSQVSGTISVILPAPRRDRTTAAPRDVRTAQVIAGATTDHHVAALRCSWWQDERRARLPRAQAVRAEPRVVHGPAVPRQRAGSAASAPRQARPGGRSADRRAGRLQGGRRAGLQGTASPCLVERIQVSPAAHAARKTFDHTEYRERLPLGSRPVMDQRGEQIERSRRRPGARWGTERPRPRGRVLAWTTQHHRVEASRCKWTNAQRCSAAFHPPPVWPMPVGAGCFRNQSFLFSPALESHHCHRPRTQCVHGGAIPCRPGSPSASLPSSHNLDGRRYVSRERAPAKCRPSVPGGAWESGTGTPASTFLAPTDHLCNPIWNHSGWLFDRNPPTPGLRSPGI